MFGTGKQRVVIFLAAAVLVVSYSTAAAMQQEGKDPTRPRGGAAATPQQGEKATQAPGGAAAKKSPQSATPGKAWRVRVSVGPPVLVTLNAKEGPMAEIAADMGRQLGVPVILSPVMTNQRVTLDFVKYPLEAAVRLLAPQSYIDYEVTGDYSAQPKPIAIYLNAFNEAPPAANAVVKGTSEAILIEGDTEEGTEAEASNTRQASDKDDPPLRVTYEKNQLSVRARKQPLSVVLYAITDKLGIPFEVRSDNTELVDVNFTNYSVEQAVRNLSPSVRFYYRTDLQTSEIKPLRIVLAAAAKS